MPDAPVALITGCSSGIGRALALELHRRAWRVFATARRPDSLQDLAAAGMDTLALDVTDDASVAAAVGTVLARVGGVDLLVNNAGFGLMGPVIEVEPDALRRQLDTNVVGALAVARAVAPGMIGRGRGCIVNVGSVSGILATPFAGAYCASKSALHALSDALRIELAPFGVHVVSLQPGAVASRFGDTAAHSLGDAGGAGSPYGPIADFIRRRAGTSQEGAMPAEDFARRVVDAVTRPRPPAVLRLGPHAVQMPFLRWLLPARALDAILSRRFGLDRLRPRG